MFSSGPQARRGAPVVPDFKRGSVLVLGAGVSGLTTTWCLLEAGFDVKVTAKRFAPHLVSNVAGALWEWPPAVCGYHHDQISLSRSKEWCMTSYDQFIQLSRHSWTGVALRRSNFYFSYQLETNQTEFHKMRELEASVEGFVRDTDLIERNCVNPNYGVVDAYRHLAPIIDTDRYLEWIRGAVEDTGATIASGEVKGNLTELEGALREEHAVDAVVNCTGLGSETLHGRPMYPLRGALVRANNRGPNGPVFSESHCVSHDESRDEQDIVFIVPRNDNTLVLGGLAEPHEWGTSIGLDNHQPIRDMYQRCLSFMPALKRAQLDEREPVRVGLRPFRKGNVCVEHQEETRIVHNYAHGGAGFTLSWGCARETADLVVQAVSGEHQSRKRWARRGTGSA